MKPYRILKDFKGSQTGNDGPHAFTAGETAQLSDWLAETVVKAGLAEPVGAEPAVDGASPADGTESRETKVTAPAETKPMDMADMPQKTLLALARERFGLTFKGNPSKQAILDAIAQQEDKA